MPHEELVIEGLCRQGSPAQPLRGQGWGWSQHPMALKEGRGSCPELQDLGKPRVRSDWNQELRLRLVGDRHLWQLRGSPATLLAWVIFPSTAPRPGPGSRVPASLALALASVLLGLPLRRLLPKAPVQLSFRLNTTAQRQRHWAFGARPGTQDLPAAHRAAAGATPTSQMGKVSPREAVPPTRGLLAGDLR